MRVIRCITIIIGYKSNRKDAFHMLNNETIIRMQSRLMVRTGEIPMLYVMRCIISNTPL